MKHRGQGTLAAVSPRSPRYPIEVGGADPATLEPEAPSPEVLLLQRLLLLNCVLEQTALDGPCLSAICLHHRTWSFLRARSVFPSAPQSLC